MSASVLGAETCMCRSFIGSSVSLTVDNVHMVCALVVQGVFPDFALYLLQKGSRRPELGYKGVKVIDELMIGAGKRQQTAFEVFQMVKMAVGLRFGSHLSDSFLIWLH